MNIIGLDTSTAGSAACALRADGEAFESVPHREALDRPPAHARELLPAIEAVLADSGLAWREVDAIAVGQGPGSFTGLRIGIATARALGHAHRIALRPVSSLAALAAGIDSRLALPLIDARRGQLFAALYEDGDEVWPPFVASPEELLERLVGTPGGTLAAGDGSLRFRHVLEGAGVEVAPDPSRVHVVRALHLCRLAADAESSPPEAVLPLYLRAPDAKANVEPAQ